MDEVLDAGGRTLSEDQDCGWKQWWCCRRPKLSAFIHSEASMSARFAVQVLHFHTLHTTVPLSKAKYRDARKIIQMPMMGWLMIVHARINSFYAATAGCGLFVLVFVSCLILHEMMRVVKKYPEVYGYHRSPVRYLQSRIHGRYRNQYTDSVRRVGGTSQVSYSLEHIEDLGDQSTGKLQSWAGSEGHKRSQTLLVAFADMEHGYVDHRMT